MLSFFYSRTEFIFIIARKDAARES